MMSRKTKRKMWTSAFKVWGLLLALMLGWAGIARAEYFVIRDYHVALQILDNGELQFTETIEVEFISERHGIFRAIPLVNRIEGKYKKLILEDVTVDNWPFTTGWENSNYILKIGDPDRYVNGRQTYVIHYRAKNGLNFFDHHAELYWDLLGIGWEVIVEKFRFDVRIPAKAPVSLDDVRVFTGPAGSITSEAKYTLNTDNTGTLLSGFTERPFSPGEAVTLAIRLPKGAFPEPDPWDVWYQLHGILLLPGALLSSILGLIFFSRNKRQSVVVELQPPLDISPVVAGGFIDHSVDNRDVLSLIPFLAEKGFLKMEVSEVTTLWVFKSQNIVFTKLREPNHELAQFERRFLNALFATGNEVELDSLKDRFYRHLSAIRTDVKDWIQEQNLYEPDQRTNRFIAYGAGIVCGLMGFWTLMHDNLDGFVLLICAVVIFLLSRFFRKRNESGNLLYQRLEGFRRFVKKAEKPVLERLLKEDPKYFDKTLPYAVAFGEVERWTRQFDGLLSEPPQWYHSGLHATSGPQRFSMDSFGSHFASEINDIGSVFSSSPSSSGSGGGGSSGGGSGGGGGGSW